MAGGAIVDVASGGNNGGRITVALVITCLVAASGGLIFGYDIGVTGGVTTMPAFLEKFFPQVAKQAAGAKQTVYCVYNSHTLTAFTSSLYISGFLATMVASSLSASHGRKFTMLCGGLTFLLGGILTGAAEHVSMLILGRLLLGVGVGFNNQATPVYLSEMAPSKWRGAINIGFQFFIGIGCIVAALVNYFAGSIVWGWRLSLGFAVVPAIIMIVGTLFVLESPSSLVERDRIEEARNTLIKVRGIPNVEAELAELIKAAELARAAKEAPFFTIFQRQYRPHLVMSIAIPFFQQVGGICVIAFYGPAILASLGSGQDAALFAAILLGVVNIFSILVSIYVVDRFGRRVLFLQGGLQMIISMVAMALLLETTVGGAGTSPITKNTAMLMLAFMCIFAAGFGWSWGPLSWIVPSEIFPLKIRPIGQSISVGVNFLTTFVISQTFLAILCEFKYGTFFFFAAWGIVMTTFVGILLPETKGIHLDSMNVVWQQHWFWRRFMKQLPISGEEY